LSTTAAFGWNDCPCGSIQEDEFQLVTGVHKGGLAPLIVVPDDDSFFSPTLVIVIIVGHHNGVRGVSPTTGTTSGWTKGADGPAYCPHVAETRSCSGGCGDLEAEAKDFPLQEVENPGVVHPVNCDEEESHDGQNNEKDHQEDPPWFAVVKVATTPSSSSTGDGVILIIFVTIVIR